MFESVRKQLLEQVRIHVLGRAAIEQNQQRNLDQVRASMTEREREFWSEDSVFTPEDLRREQIKSPPWGVWGDRTATWPRVSSGSSGQQSLKFPYNFEQVLSAGIGPARAFDVRGITSKDALFAYDPGRMYSGHMAIKTAFALILPGHLIESQVTTMAEKVRQCLDDQVTFICGVPRNLEKMARYVIEHGIQMPLRGCVSTGYAFTAEQQDLIRNAFRCEIIDLYGQVECGNIFWGCNHGQKHVNIDLTMIKNKDHKSFFTGLSVMPLFNYYNGDRLEYHWTESACGCGSHLPVVTRFETGLNKNYKNKE